jgi:hypothetical protein
MDRFIARENIRHFRDLLASDVKPELRARVQSLLLQEEDKFGRDVELLADIEKHIAATAQRIDAQRLRVSALQANGRDSLAQAQAFLDGMMQSQSLHMRYHQLITTEIERNRL